MRLEHIPLIAGLLVVLVGIGLVVDAYLPERLHFAPERRRRVRAERHPLGEALIGGGIICCGAAIIGRDTWAYGTVAVLIGAVLLGAGAWLNREFLRELLLFRGAARRSEVEAGTAPATAGATATAVPKVVPNAEPLFPRRTSTPPAPEREGRIPLSGEQMTQSSPADAVAPGEPPPRRPRIR